ncbi:RNA 2',3'-cyclic phosphodiesterase [Deltaproteobacteria bacterium TL4]
MVVLFGVDSSIIGIDGASWMDYSGYHLTLCFIGEVSAQDYQRIKSELAEIKTAPFEIQLKNVGFFPPRKEPRILWVGVEANDALMELHQAINKRLTKLGIQLEKRKYAPHITVARLKHVEKEQLMPFLIAHSLFKTERFQVMEFSLYSSLLTSEGAMHNVERSYALGN